MKIIIRTDMEGTSGVFSGELMQLGFKFVESAEKAAMIPCLRREDMYTISYQADNLIEIRKALLAAIALADR